MHHPRHHKESSPECSMEGEKNYNHYKRRVGGESSSSNSSSRSNLRMGYHRSSSNSSTASSGKQLVKNHHSHNPLNAESLYGRLERSYNHAHHTHRRTDGLSSSSPSPSPEVHKKPQPKFFLGPPSTPGSAKGYHSPLRSSPSPSPEMPSSPTNERVKSPHLLHPGYGLELHPGHVLTPPDRNSKISSIYDAYWHIPRASLWGKEGKCCCEDQPERCSQCQLRDEISSTCSSVNPPPTFTAMDNYHPIKRRQSKCGAVFAVTTIFSTIVLLLIAAFIIYIEMVLKRNQYIPDPM